MQLSAEFLNKLKAGAEDQRQNAEARMHQAEGAIAMLDVLVRHLETPEAESPSEK